MSSPAPALGDQPPILAPLPHLSLSLSLALSFSDLGILGQPRSRGFVLTVQSFDRPLTSRDQVYNDLRMRKGRGKGRAKERDERCCAVE